MLGTARDYFETDGSGEAGIFLACRWDFVVEAQNVQTQEMTKLDVARKAMLSTESGSIHNAFYFPSDLPRDAVAGALRGVIDRYAGSAFLDLPPALPQLSFGPHGDRHLAVRRLVDTRLLDFYLDVEVDNNVKNELYSYGDQNGVFVRIRDQSYARNRNMRARPAYFICHDSRDKESVATPLAIELGKQLGTIWYDDFSIRPGDSLRAGFKTCLQGFQAGRRRMVVFYNRLSTMTMQAA
jgi:hypothetical protein